MLLVLLGLIGIGLFVLGQYSRKKFKDDDMWRILWILGSGCIIATLTVSIEVPICNQSQKAEIVAFYNENVVNYKTTIDKTEDILSVEMDSVGEYMIEGSIEKSGTGTALSNRIAEYRDNVNQYNKDLARMRAYNKNIWLGILYPSTDELQPIVIN